MYVSQEHVSSNLRVEEEAGDKRRALLSTFVHAGFLIDRPHGVIFQKIEYFTMIAVRT
jgi:hypothetical protein